MDIKNMNQSAVCALLIRLHERFTSNTDEVVDHVIITRQEYDQLHLPDRNGELSHALPPYPIPAQQHGKLGPLFDRLQLEFYAIRHGARLAAILALEDKRRETGR